MLKQLITQWKAHRKKPTLLPEETEVHFEETSTVNPIFEDNESATTSAALGELSAVIDSFASDIESHDSVATNGNLIDIIPEESRQIVLEPINKKPEENIDNQTERSGATSSANNREKLAFESTRANHSYLHSKASSDLKRISDSETVVKKVEQDPLESSESFQSQGKTDLIKEENTNEDQGNTDVNSNAENLQSIMIIKVPDPPNTTPSFKLNIVKPSTSEKLDDSADKLPVIADLIKKFQSSSDKVEQNLEDSPNAEQKKSSDVEKVGIKKPVNTTKTEAFKPEKEALSKIFNFPPPPPIEPSKTIVNKFVPLKPNKSFLASVASAAKNRSAFQDSHTKSDSSLDRNKTVSSEINNTGKSDINTNSTLSRLPNEPSISNSIQNLAIKLTRVDSTTKDKKTLENIIENKSIKSNSDVSSRLSSESPVINTAQKLTRTDSTVKDKKVLESIIENKSLNSNSAVFSSLINESPAHKLTRADSTAKEKKNLENIIAVKQIKAEKQFSDTLPSTSTPKATNLDLTETFTQPKLFSSYRKETSTAKSSPIQEPNRNLENKRSSFGQKSQDAVLSQMEAKSAKSHSEDSGITRGDQISSEATQENPESQPQSDKESLRSSSPKKTKRERKISHNRTRSCKSCRQSFTGEVPLKRGKCDDYYDQLIGAYQGRRTKHSESWASDLSWEERELIRKLRSRRTLRSDSPSISSGRSQRHKPESGYFHRPHALRRSLSEDGSFLGSPMCPCDECWMHLVKYYAYGRSSLRGYTHKEDLCTCRTRHPDLVSRKVKFQSDTIPEASSSERTLSTPTIPEESEKKEDTTSTEGKKTDKVKKEVEKSGKSKEKSLDTKALKEKYRLMTPWELEEWDMAVRKQLLIKRRRRARNMGLMALAMVILIGLIVTGVMIYLRRRTI